MKIKEIVENIQAQGPNTQWTVKSSDTNKGITVVNKANPSGPQLTIPPNQVNTLQAVKPHQFMVSKPTDQVGQNTKPEQSTQPSATSGQAATQTATQTAAQPGQATQPQAALQNAPMTGDMVEIPDSFFATETLDELDKFDKHDMMASGKNSDISGDAGDALLAQIIDRDAENAARGIRKPRHSIKKMPQENDELDKWLTIAGLR